MRRLSAAADDRSFIIGAYEGLNVDSLGGIRLDLRLFQFRISGGGKPGHLTELAPSPARGQGFQCIALSPDGKLLAVSLLSGPDDSTGTLQVINLATGTIRTWTAPVTGPQYAPGAPSWVDGNQMIAFTWQGAIAQGTGYVTEGVRLLDIAAPGDNLADAKLIVPSGVVTAGAIKSALITPDGRDVIAVTLRDLSPLASSHTVIVQLAELQAGTGRLIRVLRTQTARLDQDAFISLQSTLEMLSFDSAGQYVLVQGIQFGWLEVGGPDPGRFTPLPLPPGRPVRLVCGLVNRPVTRRWRRRCARAAGRRAPGGGRTPRSCAGRSCAATSPRPGARTCRPGRREPRPRRRA